MSAFIANDYAGIEAAGMKLYYGYEATDASGNWCFEATINGETLTIPFPELGALDSTDVGECLLCGIALLLERGVLAGNLLAGHQKPL